MEGKKRSKGRGWESCYVRDVWCRNESVRAKLVQFCTHTHARTHARAAKLVVEMATRFSRTFHDGRMMTLTYLLSEDKERGREAHLLILVAIDGRLMHQGRFVVHGEHFPFLLVVAHVWIETHG